MSIKATLQFTALIMRGITKKNLLAEIQPAFKQIVHVKSYLFDEQEFRI